MTARSVSVHGHQVDVSAHPRRARVLQFRWPAGTLSEIPGFDLAVADHEELSHAQLQREVEDFLDDVQPDWVQRIGSAQQAAPAG